MLFFNKLNIKLNILLTSIIYIICLFSQSSCSIYKMDIFQGVDIDEYQLNKLTPRLTKKQVQEILGNPSLDPLHKERLDYYYLNKTNNQNITIKKHLILYFNSNAELISYDGDVQVKNLNRKSR